MCRSKNIMEEEVSDGELALWQRALGRKGQQRLQR